MAEQTGIHILRQWQQRWIGYQLIADILLAAAWALLAGSILHYVFMLPLAWGLLVFALVLVPLLLMHRPWLITNVDVSRFLNTAYPELEESCELVIKPRQSLNVLESLQQHKVEMVLNQLDQPKKFTRRLQIAALTLIAALLLSFVISKLNYHYTASSISNIFRPSVPGSKNTVPEKLLPQIESVSVKINPPSYTGKAEREQNRFGLEVEEDARVTWTIATNTAVTKVELLFNEKEKVELHAANQEKTKWTAQKQVGSSGFYQVNIEGKLSDYYKVEIIKDMPPVIRVKTPKQYTYIDAGETARVPLSVTVSDDYGVTDAFIFATIAKGSGEAVKFKEQKMSFSASFTAHQQQYQLQKLLDLPALKMEPGDELYFYIQAQDNHRQQTRTDVYIVSIQDTAQLLSMNNMTLGVSQVPEYFRSERQIIIDSEKLLKDKDTISAVNFKTRSNDIGIDQKLLRLRYGKFLGEEEESTEGSGHGTDLQDPADFSNAQKVLDAFTDKHDNAEDASFLEKDTKEQLKATLSEMWKAELNLRTFKPQDAIPFEYKALRLLKDLQQKSRAYVPKTAYNPPPLKLIEKRLSGDLTKIGQPLVHEDIKQSAGEFETLNKAAAVLEQAKQTRSVVPGDMHTLQLAGQQISVKATAQPAVYLAAVGAMHRILSAKAGKISLTDISVAEKSLQKALPLTQKLPQSAQASADMGLSQGYFKNLNRLNR